jgi:hypothetical protein
MHAYRTILCTVCERVEVDLVHDPKCGCLIVHTISLDFGSLFVLLDASSVTFYVQLKPYIASTVSRFPPEQQRNPVPT